MAECAAICVSPSQPQGAVTVSDFNCFLLTQQAMDGLPSLSAPQPAVATAFVTQSQGG